MKEIMSEIKQFLVERGWENLRPSDIAKSIAIEAAELLELFQWDSLTIEETKNDHDRMKRLGKEIADVYIYTSYLPILLGLDPEKLIRDKLAHNAVKFPADLMKNRQNKTHSAGDVYTDIKRKQRGE